MIWLALGLEFLLWVMKYCVRITNRYNHEIDAAATKSIRGTSLHLRESLYLYP